MVAAGIGIGTTVVSMILMTASGRLRRLGHRHAVTLYDLAFRFGVLAALACLGVVGWKLIAFLNDQPIGRLTLLGLFGVLVFKIWVALFARHARNALRHT